jgi:glycine oxidase
MRAPDIAIIGGGVIGCAIAYEMARRGAGRVEVVERGEPGGGASGAAAGVLAVASSRAPGGALFELRRAGAGMFPALSEDLRERSGVNIEYRERGLLKLAFSEKESAALQALTSKRAEQGFVAKWLEPSRVHDVQPGVSPALRGAAHFAGDGAVNAVLLVRALRAASERLGVVYRCTAPLTGMEVSAGRVLGITAGGERLTPGTVVVAAGAWSAEIGSLLRVKVPVRPDKGEMIALRNCPPILRTVSWDDGYLAPRCDGEVLVGSTSTRGVFDTFVMAGSVQLLLERAVHMVPALREATVVRMWAGLRPCPTIRRPIIGPVRGYENVVLATGHHRSGVLLAPITARLVAELILEQATSVDLRPFCYRPR